MDQWSEGEARSRGEVLGGLLPPEVHGSAADLPGQPGDVITPEYLLLFERGELPFWRPGVADVLWVIGWRWLILVPALALVVGLPAALIASRHVGMAGHSLKFWLLGVGVVITIVIGAAKRGVTGRRDVFCIHCGYTIEGLPDGSRCPECGRVFRLSVVHEFRKDPHFFMTRVKALRTHPRHSPFTSGDGPTPDDGTR